MLQMTLLRHNSELVTAARNPKAIQSAFDFPERLAPRQELLPRRRWVGGGGGGGGGGGSGGRARLCFILPFSVGAGVPQDQYGKYKLRYISL